MIAVLFAAFLAAQAADTTITIRCLRAHTCIEANPLMPSTPAGIAAVKIGVSAAVIWQWRALRKEHPKLAKVAVWVGIVSGSAATIYNIRALRRANRHWR